MASLNGTQSGWLDVASYHYPNSSDVTVWLAGYLAPSVSSDYLFSVATNGYAKFYVSTDSTSANKVKDDFFRFFQMIYEFSFIKQLVASYDPSQNVYVSLSRTLQGGKMYYLQVVVSNYFKYIPYLKPVLQLTYFCFYFVLNIRELLL